VSDKSVNVPEFMVWGAFRYALGRHSYVTGATADALRQLMSRNELSHELLRQVSAEVRDHIERTKDQLIHRFDNDIWEQLLHDIDAEVNV
jgi:hypothetical protein